MTAWSAWRDHPRMVTSPYVDWWLMQHMLGAGPRPIVMVPALTRMDAFDTLKSEASVYQSLGSDPVSYAPGTTNDLAAFPVPASSANPNFLDHVTGSDSWLPDTGELPSLTADTLVIGVIDVDIALGHRRFRHADGSSRVLASWQQGAPWGGSAHLPFGQELKQGAIDALLQTHSHGDLTRPLDQDGFNRAAGLVDYDRPDSLRDLAKREAHGTHVMGLAAGSDPVDQAAFSERVKMLVVNLPPASAYGEGGAFLDYYLVYAMRWIVETHARMARSSGLAETPPLLFKSPSPR